MNGFKLLGLEGGMYGPEAPIDVSPKTIFSTGTWRLEGTRISIARPSMINRQVELLHLPTKVPLSLELSLTLEHLLVIVHTYPHPI
jgi:hypothetical protein